MTGGTADAAGLVLYARRVASVYASRSPVGEHVDILSDAMLGAVLAAQRYDPTSPASLTTYAGHVIRGQILEGLRNRGRIPCGDGRWKPDARRLASVNVDDLDMADRDDPIGDLIDRLEDDATMAWLRAAIARLPERQRQAAARCLAGQTAQEAADELGHTVATMFAATAQAKRNLRRAALHDGIAA